MSDDRPGWFQRHRTLLLGGLAFAAVLAGIVVCLAECAPDGDTPRGDKGKTRQELWDYLKR